MPKPARPVDVINSAQKNGVALSRFRITKEQAAELWRIEHKEGQAGGLRFLLEIFKESS